MKNLHLGRALILLASFLFLVSCCSKKVAVQSLFKPQGSSPVNNSSVYFIVKKNFAQVEEGEMVLLSTSTGSGSSVFSSSTHSNILTAGHVCVDMISFISSATSYTTFDHAGKSAKAEVIGLDLESDLCLLRINRESTPMQVSDGVINSGEEVYYGGYPLGMYMPYNLHHFRGYYSGTDSESFSMFSLAAAPGSSGSAIVNRKGEIISVVSAVTADFQNLTIGAGLERLKPFLAKYSN